MTKKTDTGTKLSFSASKEQLEALEVVKNRLFPTVTWSTMLQALTWLGATEIAERVQSMINNIIMEYGIIARPAGVGRPVKNLTTKAGTDDEDMQVRL